MGHAVYSVVAFDIVEPFTLRVAFDDGSEQVIDFRSVLAGELYGPLRDEVIFNQVEIDPETRTLVWPNGADFDPETLRNWPEYAEAMQQMADRWPTAERTRRARPTDRVE